MLVLNRQKHEDVVIGDDIVVSVVAIRKNFVRLGITAPKDITVHRREVYDRLAVGESLRKNRNDAMSAVPAEPSAVSSGDGAIGDGTSSPVGEAGCIDVAAVMEKAAMRNAYHALRKIAGWAVQDVRSPLAGNVLRQIEDYARQQAAALEDWQ